MPSSLEAPVLPTNRSIYTPSKRSVLQLQNPESGISPTQPISNLMGAPETFNAALETQANDYDNIMKSYQSLLEAPNATPRTRMEFTPIAPQLAVYQRSPELANSMLQLSSAAKTGGYEGDELANIRARSISPIRSVYANAQRGLDRNRSLQGGYSPNYAAATTKMAREQSEQIAQATTNVEAGLGENISRNRLSALTSLAPLTAQDTNAQNQFNLSNADTVNRMNELNRMMPLQYEQFNREDANVDNMRRLQAIEGMRGLYGTTPALSSLFGSQNIQQQQINANANESQAQKKAEKDRTALSLLSMYGRPRYGSAG